MKTQLKKLPTSDKPQQPADTETHQLQVGTAETREKAADTQAASTVTGVKSGNETDSTGQDSKVGASDGKPAAPPTTLTREQLEVANQFRAKRAQPNCPEVELGLDLIDIIRNVRLPVRGGVVRNSAALLGLSSDQVRDLVELAREHRTQNGGKTCSPGTDIRPSGSNASKQPPASPSEAAAGDERSAAPAPIPAPEKMSARTKKLKATEVAEPQAGEAVQDRALPPVETTQPGPAEPALAPAGPSEQAAQADTAPPVAEPETRPAECVGQAPVQVMAEDDEVPAPDNAGRPTIPTHRVRGSPAPSNAAGVEDANETASPSHERLTMPVADARKDKLDRCVTTLTSPDSSRLDRGYALLSIIEDRLLLILSDGTIVDSRKKLGVTRSEVSKLVALARDHRDQIGGGGVSAPGEGARHDGDSASKQPPTSPTHAAAADGGSTAPASTSTVEQSPGAKKRQSAVRETSRPLNGGNHDNFTQPAIELPPSVSREPADADAKATEHPTGVSGDPAVNGQSKQPQKASKRAVNEAKVGTTLSPIEQEQRLLQLETIVVNGFTTLWEMGKAMLEIRDRQLYLKRYNTFQEYCVKRWGKQRSRCYQLMVAAEVQQNLMSTQVDIAELTEKHCRELGKLKTPEDQCTAWKETAASADGNVSLVHLKQAVAKLLPPAQPMHPDKAPATAAPLGEAAEAAPDHALPVETHAEPATDQPESPPATVPAAFARDEFDLDEEWLVVEQTLTSLFRRCPKYKRQVLWRHLNAYSEQNSELIPAD